MTAQLHVESKPEKRKALRAEVQKILPDDLSYIFLWFTEEVSVHRRERGDFNVPPTGDYDFLAALRPPARK